MPVLHFISSFEDTAYKKLQDTAISSFFSCCFISGQLLHQQISFFYKFVELHSGLSEKIFSSPIFLC